MIIFDLDGTLADCEHRTYLINPEKYSHLYEYSNYRLRNGRPYNDLDGKSSWRCKKTGEPFKHGWKAFYEACDKDKPIHSTIDLLSELILCDRDVVIWSGRCESIRNKTIQWLYDNIFYSWSDPELGASIPLIMRPVNDHTPDEQLKENWLDDAIEKGIRIEYVFDDRPKVVRMWRIRGIFVFDCNQTGKEF